MRSLTALLTLVGNTNSHVFLCVRFAEALVRADRDLHEGKPEDMLKISEAIKTAEDYSKLTGQLKTDKNK